ncbi:MAG: hypothetical protein K6C95_00575, partial [Lachnospiraceae bacterium]|nr:hypothetical protein [Lachnospiraceae bacterium]
PEEKAVKVTKLAFERNKLTIQTSTPFVSNPATPVFTGEGETPAVHYATENRDIVAVDQSGNFYPVGQGSATVTAYCGNKKTSCKVTVVSYTNNLYIINEDNEDVTGGEMSIAGGQQAFLTVLFNPYDSTDPRNVTWKSDNKKITVKKGLVTAKEVTEETTAVITAVVKATDPSNGSKIKISRTVTIKAIPAVPEKAVTNDKSHGLTVTKKKSMVTTENNNIKEITVKITGKKNTTGDEFEILSIASTNEDVVEAGVPEAPVVSGKGQTCKLPLTAKHPGTAYIVVKSRAKASEDGKVNIRRCKVTVKSPVQAVHVEDGTLDVEQNGTKKTITMRKGTKGTVEVVLDPEYSTDLGNIKIKATGGITYKNGIITAGKVTKAGKPAKLKVTCGKKKETVYVTVKK